jgi:integrase
MIPGAVYRDLLTVQGLQSGRTEARDSAVVRPVNEEIVVAVLPHLPAVVADIVRLQRLTGMRPQEVCLMRPMDIEQSGEVWIYRPKSHKTEHRGRDRVVFCGPQSQAILLKYMARGSDDYCFQPRDSEAKRRAAQHAARVVPLHYGNRPGTNRRSKPRRTAGDHYTVDSYRRAIHRACDKAFPAPEDVAPDPAKLAAWQSEHRWSPNRLRHSAGTEIRRRFGLEAAQVVLGHSKADVTQIYAERDYALGARVAKEVG